MYGMEDKREKKKKKIERAVPVKSPCRWRPHLPIDLVFDLLTHLPVKELLRCFCVSKAWRSIILQPRFSDAYRRRNPTIFVFSLSKYLVSYYYYSSFRDDEFFVRLAITLNSSNKLLGSTEVINGLVCRYNLYHVNLYNTWNGEVMRLPDPPATAPADPALDFLLYRYFFGLDPVHGVYKLVRMICHGASNRQFYILTLGTNCSWRELNNQNVPSFPETYLFKKSVLVNGILYWKGENGLNNELVSFDLIEEKFSIIPTPDLLLYACLLVQFRGRLCLFPRYDPVKMVLYMLENSQGGGSYAWKRHKTELPRELQATTSNTRVVPLGSLPTGEMLLLDADFEGNSTVVYSYNYSEVGGHAAKGTFKRFSIAKLPDCINLPRYWDEVPITLIEPNFRTLDSLIHGVG